MPSAQDDTISRYRYNLIELLNSNYDRHGSTALELARKERFKLEPLAGARVCSREYDRMSGYLDDMVRTLEYCKKIERTVEKYV